MFKKLISTVLAIGIVVSNVGVSAALAAEKLPDGGAKYINAVVNAKIMSVYSDGTFRPSELMTREKLARFIDAGLVYRDPSLSGYDNTKNYSTMLKDVTTNDFYFPYIASMADKGIIKGFSDKTFKGKNTVTRGEAITMLIRAYKLINNVEIPDYSKSSDLLTTEHRFNDVTSSNGFYNNIYFALENGFIVKNPSFRVSDTITKYEISVLIYRMLLGNGEFAPATSTSTETPTGTTTSSTLYSGAKVTASNVNLSIFSTKLAKLSFTNDAKFDGKLPYVNKANVKITLNGSAMTSSVAKVSLLSRDASTITYGLVFADDVFKSTDLMTVAYDDKSFKIDGTTSGVSNTNTGTTSTGSTTTTNTGSTSTGSTVANGSISVSLATDNPAYQYVPNNATSVEMLKTVFDAANDTTLTNVTIKRTGLGNATDIKYVKLYINGVKAGSDRTINSSDNLVTFYVPNSMQKLPAGKNSIVVKADFNSVSNSFSKIQIESISSIVAGGTVTGTFPIVGNDVQTAGVSAGTVNYTTYAGTNGTYYIGDTKKELLKFDLATSSVEGANLKTIRFRLSGSARITDLAKLALYDSDGKAVASSGTVTADGYVTFNLAETTEGYLLEKGITKTMYLKGDIVSGRTNSTVAFDIENDSDIFAIGTIYKFGTSVKETSSSTVPSKYTIKGGKLSVSLAQDSAPAKDISPRSNNVQLAKFNFTTQGDSVKIQTMKLLVIAQDNHTTFNNATSADIARVSNVENFKVVVGNNSFVYGPIDLAQPSSDVTYSLANEGFVGTNHSTSTLANNGQDVQVITIDEDFNIPANATTPMVVTANLVNAAGKADTYQVKLLVTKSDGSTLVVGQNDTTEDTITSSDITPSGANSQISGNVMTVDTAKITTSLKAVPGSKTVSKNSKQAELFGFTIAAGTASDVRLSSLKISRDSDLAGSSISDLENIRLYIGDKKVSGSIGNSFVDATVDYVLFDDLRNEDGSDVKLTAGQQYDFVVKADVSPNAVVGNKGRFYIASADDINATDLNSQTLATTQKIFGDSVINSTTDTQAPIFTVQEGGLSIALDNSSPVRGQLTAGQTAKSVFAFKLSARNEDVYVKTLRLKVNSTPGNVYRLEMFDGDTSLGGGAKTVISGIATWSLSNTDRIKIAAGTDKIIMVKADVMTSDNSIAQSGGDFTVSLDSSTPVVIESESGNSQPVVGYKTTTTRTSDTLNGALGSTQSSVTTTVGQASWIKGDVIKVDNEEMLVVTKNSNTSYGVVRGMNGTTATTHLNNATVTAYDSTATTTVAGNVFTVYYTLPADITAVTLPTTTLQAGQDQVVGSFKFKASANADATSNKLTLKSFRVSKAGSVQISNVRLYNKLDSSIFVNGTFTSGNKVEFDMTGLTGGKNEITEDTDATFEVKAMIDYVPAGATLSMNINDIAGTSFSDSDLGWSDGVGDYFNIKLSSDTINGNVMSTSAQNAVGTTTDGPTVQSVVFGGTADDKVSNGDTVVITWNEAIDPSTISTVGGTTSLAAGRTVTGVTGYLGRSSAGTSLITIPGVANIIAGGDTSVNGSQASSTVSVALDSTGKVLTITVTAAGALTGSATAESFASTTPSTTTVKNLNGQFQKNTAVLPTGTL